VPAERLKHGKDYPPLFSHHRYAVNKVEQAVRLPVKLGVELVKPESLKQYLAIQRGSGQVVQGIARLVILVEDVNLEIFWFDPP